MLAKAHRFKVRVSISLKQREGDRLELITRQDYGSNFKVVRRVVHNFLDRLLERERTLSASALIRATARN